MGSLTNQSSQGLEPIPVFDITSRQREDLARQAERVNSHPGRDFESFEAEAARVAKALPDELWDKLIEFRKKGNQAGALLIKGFVNDPEIPPTPTSLGVPIAKSTFYSELWLTSVGTVLGDPVAYLQESDGKYIHDVFPTPGEAEKLSSRSSSKPLDYHTEMAFHPHSPDFVLLYALRQDPERRVMTCVSSLRNFYRRLTGKERAVLRAKRFRAGIDYSFGSESGTLGNGPLRGVLRGRSDDPFLCVDDIMDAETPEEKTALDKLRWLVVEHSQGVLLEPGSLILIDDRRAAHSRSAFRAHFDGSDRWLQRLLVLRSRDRAAHDLVPGTSVIATDFSQYFGAAETGQKGQGR